jgi:hypothetical protein
VDCYDPSLDSDPEFPTTSIAKGRLNWISDFPTDDDLPQMLDEDEGLRGPEQTEAGTAASNYKALFLMC